MGRWVSPTDPKNIMQRITFQHALRTSTSPNAILGALASTPDGSIWRYVKASAALSKGHIAVPLALVHVDTVSSSANAAGQIVYITESGATWTPGAFQNCWVNVVDGTGEGQIAKIMDNTATTLELYPDWALSTALSVSDSDIDIVYDAQLVVKSLITEPNQNAVGAAQIALSASDYAWVLASGPGVAISGTAAMTLGKNFTTGDDTAGQVIIGVTAKGEFDGQTLGFSLSANSTADKGFLAQFQLV